VGLWPAKVASAHPKMYHEHNNWQSLAEAQDYHMYKRRAYMSPASIQWLLPPTASDVLALLVLSARPPLPIPLAERASTPDQISAQTHMRYAHISSPKLRTLQVSQAEMVLLKPAPNGLSSTLTLTLRMVLHRDDLEAGSICLLGVAAADKATYSQHTHLGVETTPCAYFRHDTTQPRDTAMAPGPTAGRSVETCSQCMHASHY
jgi:hypothetical protein